MTVSINKIDLGDLPTVSLGCLEDYLRKMKISYIWSFRVDMNHLMMEKYVNTKWKQNIKEATYCKIPIDKDDVYSVKFILIILPFSAEETKELFIKINRLKTLL